MTRSTRLPTRRRPEARPPSQDPRTQAARDGHGHSRHPLSLRTRYLSMVDAAAGRAASLTRVRLISGTTVSRVGRVAAGTFSERLFYRLNIIHLGRCGRPGESDFAGTNVP